MTADAMPLGAAAAHQQTMMTPDDWPTWPYLVIVRGAQHALLVDERPAETGAQPKVYLRELHDVCGFDCPTVEYETFDALVADGWRVAP